MGWMLMNFPKKYSITFGILWLIMVILYSITHAKNILKVYLVQIYHFPESHLKIFYSNIATNYNYFYTIIKNTLLSVTKYYKLNKTHLYIKSIYST